VNASTAEILNLLAAVGFIVALKMLSAPKRALGGNFVGALGMGIATVVTLIAADRLNNVGWIAGAGLGGAAVGAVLARRVPMTAMPQFVALFNGFGGLASALVSLGEVHINPDPDPTKAVVICLGIVIGAVTFTGSMIAYAKLQGLLTGAPITYPFQKTSSVLLFGGGALLTVLFATNPSQDGWLYAIAALSLVLGVTATIPIGGADMPVVIALLNSYSGLAGSAAGYVIQSNVLIISGALVGASGIILSVIMCRAMNRSLANVLFSAFGSADSQGTATGAPGRTVRRYTVEDVSMLLANARKVVIVPGYGLAVAQAQHVVRELADVLQKRGTEVSYAIHPVAGRMPGHMNVLLAEANVPYEQLKEMDQINPEFETTDVVLVLGANDVVNPAARKDPKSPIYGMPILDVDKAQTVVVVKRSMGSGFAGIENELFFYDNTMMLFGDAKKVVTDLLTAVKAY
jgi:NAD(P) transhydrogenase subunit beta